MFHVQPSPYLSMDYYVCHRYYGCYSISMYGNQQVSPISHWRLSTVGYSYCYSLIHHECSLCLLMEWLTGIVTLVFLCDGECALDKRYA
jgi:hypothetical protein